MSRLGHPSVDFRGTRSSSTCSVTLQAAAAASCLVHLSCYCRVPSHVRTLNIRLPTMCPVISVPCSIPSSSPHEDSLRKALPAVIGHPDHHWNDVSEAPKMNAALALGGTPMIHWWKSSDTTPQEELRQGIGRIPMGRVGSLLFSVILFLCHWHANESNLVTIDRTSASTCPQP